MLESKELRKTTIRQLLLSSFVDFEADKVPNIITKAKNKYKKGYERKTIKMWMAAEDE